MREILLSKSKVALVDDEDFEYLSQWKWSYHNGGYAVRRQHLPSTRKHQLYKMILMHRAIMNPSSDKDVDHINRNKLDNRRSNLRVCSDSENLHNSKLRVDSKSGYKGVSWYKAYKKWVANIQLDGRLKFLGYFESPEAAARAYDEASLERFGEFARPNFPVGG